MIKLDHIFRTFKVGDELVHGLDDVTLDIKTGEYISIMGPSGSGKSTLLNAIGLLDKLDKGRYLLDGSDVTELSEIEQARVRREKKLDLFFKPFI